ncbi:hypothetical protein [Asticcacaulis excentricus]|uniref:Uncharacterized protein n=1 Tax=Asticcacaulis excentricus TaxID=78587 RepID=A0A3G9G6P5_9CAUL|nr:hypothetical protein [Asticcacaulis excentricus]BBF79928.1 hypothetical protein EM6_0505 [Asticcacaulis excentricus]
MDTLDHVFAGLAAMGGGLVSALYDWHDVKGAARKTAVGFITGFVGHPWLAPFLINDGITPQQASWGAAFLIGLTAMIIVEVIIKMASTKARQVEGNGDETS